MTYQVWIGIFSIGGSILGAYLGVKIAVARLEERSLATDATVRYLHDRIERLENLQLAHK